MFIFLLNSCLQLPITSTDTFLSFSQALTRNAKYHSQLMHKLNPSTRPTHENRAPFHNFLQKQTKSDSTSDPLKPYFTPAGSLFKGSCHMCVARAGCGAVSRMRGCVETSCPMLRASSREVTPERCGGTTLYNSAVIKSFLSGPESVINAN